MSDRTDQPVVPDMNPNYKFREVRMYSSDEWMANSTKKYRKVFDRWETTYLRSEISFFNKQFDELEWDVSVRSKCYFLNGSQKNEICNYEEKRKVLKDENIVFARHSWGKAEPGDYWKKGNYVWEAYIDEIKVGETFFYIEDIGHPATDHHQFFDIESIRLYEGDNQASNLPQKKYVSKFSQKETKYIWCELNIRNKIPQDYYAEIIYLYSDSDGQFKGSQSYLAYIPPDTKGSITTIAAGWGNQTTGSWFNDKYTIDILFLDTLIATVPFEVGDVFEEGQAQVITDSAMLKTGAPHLMADAGKSKEQILHDSLEELNTLTGLEKIKEEVNEMVSLVQYYQEAGKDVLNKFSLHSVFTGNPGTGKTTVARIISKIYQGLGLLEKGHLVEVDREGLVAGYVGQTAIKTAEKINEAMGGVLFIDEAYALANEKGSPYDFGGESIQVILKRMEDQRGKFGVIVAGYTENMHRFINSNPGLKSRFDKYFHFEDYTPDQMFIIALSMFRHEEVLPDVDAATHLKKYFSILYDHRDEHFGNARTVRQTVAEAVKNQNLRLAALPKEQRTAEMISTVVLQDVIEFELKPPAGSKGKIGFKN